MGIFRAILGQFGAGSLGTGGVLTTALRRAVRELSVKKMGDEFSIWSVFKRAKKYAGHMTKEQDLVFQFNGTEPKQMAWPMSFAFTEYLHHPLIDVKKDLEQHEQQDILE